MKKLLLFLLIFAIFLTGCSTVAPADEGTTPPTDDVGDETLSGGQDDKAPANSDEENSQKEPLKAGTDAWVTEKKPPLVPITNAGEPQDENDDFLFVFDMKYGEFKRGAGMELKVELTNNTGEALPSENHSNFVAWIELFCITNGERYVIEHEDIPLSWVKIEGFQIEPGESYSTTFYYNIPEDAPLGEYTLECFYGGTRTLFEGYFTLTQ